MSVRLYPHQKHVIEQFRRLGRFAAHHEQGCGKTLTAIRCVEVLGDRLGKIPLTLIITPKIVCESFRREFVKFSTPTFADSVRVLSGSSKERIHTLRKSAARIFITNHEAASMVDFWGVIREQAWDMLIVDEAHRCKDPKASRTKTVIQLADRIRHKLTLTGTPVTQDMRDLWAQFRILGADVINPNYFVWVRQHFYDANSGKRNLNFPKWTPLPGAENQIRQTLLSPLSHRVTKAEVLEFLPPLIKQVVHAELTPELKAHYASLESNFVTWLQSTEGADELSAELGITKMLRLQQVCNGFFKLDNGEGRRLTYDKPKVLKALLEDLSPTNKIIVWTCFRSTYKDIAEVCDSLGLSFVSLTGDENEKEKQASIDAFQTDPSVRVIIANQAAGGVGIGLQQASVMIYYSKNFSLEKDLQSEARAHRGGSEIHKSILRIDILSRGTLEEDIHEALEKKFENAEFILSMKEKYGRRKKEAA